MNARRLITTSLRTIVRFRLRSSFMALGTLVGVAALTFVVSVGTAAERKILATVRQLFSASSIMVMGGGGRMMGGPRSDGARLTLDDMRRSRLGPARDRDLGLAEGPGPDAGAPWKRDGHGARRRQLRARGARLGPQRLARRVLRRRCRRSFGPRGPDRRDGGATSSSAARTRWAPRS